MTLLSKHRLSPVKIAVQRVTFHVLPYDDGSATVTGYAHLLDGKIYPIDVYVPSYDENSNVNARAMIMELINKSFT